MRKVLLGVLGTVLIGIAAPPDARAQGDIYLGQIIYVGFNYCPRGLAPAEGQILQIRQNQGLYSLYGNTYGGDGKTTFALPDLRKHEPAGLGHYCVAITGIYPTRN